MILNDKVYDFLKKLVQVVLPAAGALYFGLASIWGLPAAEEVVGTLAVVTTFLGVCLGISSKQYHQSDKAFDGQMVVSENEEGRLLYSLEVDGDPETLQDKTSITFKVKKDTPS